MEVVIDISEKKPLNWSARGVERITQNITSLTNTFQYEVAYDRTLGLSGRFVDKPLDQAVAMVTTEILELISQRELRATVKEIEFVGLGESGNMQFKVVVNIE